MDTTPVVVPLYMKMTVGYYKNYLYTHRYKLNSEKKIKKNKESQHMVSHPETGLDSPIGSNRDRGHDRKK